MSADAPRLRITVDDLSDPAVLALLDAHHRDMLEQSPPESVHAMSRDDLRSPTVTVWSAWINDTLAGVGALKELDDLGAELKAFRTVESLRGRGVARAILRHIIGVAGQRKLSTLWLETGSAPAFEPARRLYESEGFVVCLPYGTYRPDPLSTYMSRPVVLTRRKSA